MCGELGNETFIDFLHVSSALSPQIFRPDGESRFVLEFSVNRWVLFLSFRAYEYFIEIESEKVV